MINALSEDPGVERIWPDLPVHTWLDRQVPLVDGPPVWQAGYSGRGVKVAILDTGLDQKHPDFEGRIASYRDFVEPDRTNEGPLDPNGHGSHVAGIAAGSGAASGGRYRGVAPDASLVIGRVLDMTGNGRTSTVMAAIEWALDEGAQVINFSLGGPPFPSDGTDALSTLCNQAVDHGVVVCVAAGNMGPGGHTIGSPSATAKAITVGACDGADAAPGDRVAAFSSRGPTADGRTKPDLLFPGVGVVAPRAEGTHLGRDVDERYTSLRGTSQATPLATGAVALLLQAYPRLTPAAVKERLLAGARPLAGVDQNAQGRGRGDCLNAFNGQAGTALPGASRAVPGTPDGELLPGCLPIAASFIKKRG